MLTVWMERDGFIPTFIQTVVKANLPSSIVTIIKGLLQQDWHSQAHINKYM